MENTCGIQDSTQQNVRAVKRYSNLNPVQRYPRYSQSSISRSPEEINRIFIVA